MNHRHAFYSDLNLDAVKFSEACLIVRARIVEAAETMTYIQVKGAYPAKLKAFWPTYQYEDNTEPPQYRYTPDAAAISRADEVFYDWFSLVPDDARPKLCSYAFCQATPKKYGSIAQYCKKNRHSRSTYDRLITKVIQALAQNLCNKSQMLHHPNWKRVMTLMPNSHIKIDMMATVTYWRAGDAKPSITSPQE